MTLDSLYTLRIARESLFEGLITSDTLYLKQIDQRVLDHWVEESGFSFPSGHSFNAYLLGTILAFGIYGEKERKWRFLALIPLSWAFLVALSRVALGAHTATDVSAGAGIGLLLAFALLGISATRSLLIPKKN
jgi:phosphatidylglycerophosphatase B